MPARGACALPSKAAASTASWSRMTGSAWAPMISPCASSATPPPSSPRRGCCSASPRWASAARRCPPSAPSRGWPSPRASWAARRMRSGSRAGASVRWNPPPARRARGWRCATCSLPPLRGANSSNPRVSRPRRWPMPCGAWPWPGRRWRSAWNPMAAPCSPCPPPTAPSACATCWAPISPPPPCRWRVCRRGWISKASSPCPRTRGPRRRGSIWWSIAARCATRCCAWPSASPSAT